MKPEDFAACMLDFIGGGGPMTGLWPAFKDWILEKGYTEEEFEAACKATMVAAGQDWEG